MTAEARNIDENRGPTRMERSSRSKSFQEISVEESLSEGIALYEEFNRFGPTRLAKIRHPRVIPPVVVEVGELLGLIYRSDKGQPGAGRAYIHIMENPPRLVCNVEGRQLYIVGGSYRITRQGIEG